MKVHVAEFCSNLFLKLVTCSFACSSGSFSKATTSLVVFISDDTYDCLVASKIRTIQYQILQSSEVHCYFRGKTAIAASSKIHSLSAMSDSAFFHLENIADAKDNQTVA